MISAQLKRRFQYVIELVRGSIGIKTQQIVVHGSRRCEATD